MKSPRVRPPRINWSKMREKTAKPLPTVERKKEGRELQPFNSVLVRSYRFYEEKISQ